MSAGDPLHSVDPLHAEEVLQQVLSLSATDISALREKGAI